MFGSHVDVRRQEKHVNGILADSPVKKGLIMFYGDSDFTRWCPKYGNKSMEDEIRMKDGSQAVVNHGFGGATAEEMLYFYPKMVRPWEPRALVLRTIGNDRGAGYSPNEIMELLARVMDYARADFPGIRLFLTNAFPLLRDRGAREAEVWARKEFNALAKAYCEAHADTTLADGTRIPQMSRVPGSDDPEDLRDELFLPDKVHFTPEGYDLYRDFWLGVLEDLL